ncbi:MAG: DinB family protein [Bacteroidota bacterium]
MNFDIHKSIEILSRTPDTLDSMLTGLSEDWLKSNEGIDTWSPYDIVGHLIHGEKTDWIPRAKIILSEAEDKTFVPFDRFAQMNLAEEKDMATLLEEFRTLRAENIKELRAFNMDAATLQRKGIHPELGEANLKELLSTWVVHDLGHIAQIARVMAKQYSTEVGPWKQYLGILKR